MPRIYSNTSYSRVFSSSLYLSAIDLQFEMVDTAYMTVCTSAVYCCLIQRTRHFLSFHINYFGMASWQQIGIAIIGIAIGGGFAFGGIASYAGMTDSQANQGNQINTTMPSSTYVEEPFHLGPREQLNLAYRNDIVFVNGFYDNQEQKQQMENELSELSSRFNGRVYVSLANSTADSDILYQYGLTEFPRVVIIGGNQQYSGQPIQEISSDKVSSEVCDAFRQLGSSAAQCL